MHCLSNILRKESVQVAFKEKKPSDLLQNNFGKCKMISSLAFLIKQNTPLNLCIDNELAVCIGAFMTVR